MELQPGQVDVISDVLAMIDRVNSRIDMLSDPEEMIKALGMIGTAAALATAILVKW